MIGKKNVFKRLSLFLLLFAVVFMFYNAKAEERGEGNYCLKLMVDYDDVYPAANISSIKINGHEWNNVDVYNGSPNENGVIWTIVFTAGGSGNAQKPFPFVSTAGGLVIDDENDPNYPGYGTYTAIPNPDDDENVTGDEYLITITLKDTWPNKGTPSPDKVCGEYGVHVEATDAPINPPKVEVTSNVTITIKGEELEYHYVESEPDKADVTYFKFDINGGTEEERLVPFTFGNANYTHNDKEPPKNVTQVTTKNPIPYKYQYDGTGKVEFCVNGGGTDEYTSIKINGVEYGEFAPHTKEKYWESMEGWAQKFCIPEVPYSETYNVVVEGRDTADENKVPGFGWSYLAKERSADITEEGNFAHGRLEFVSASLVIDGEEKSFGSANLFNNYKYHDKGHIFQWYDGNKEYPEADRTEAWGGAQMPYGTTLRVRIVPDEGYQLTGLTVSENGFLPTETPGEYELTLTRTNLSYNEDQNQFDLNPRFEKIESAGVSKVDAVSNVALTIKGNNNQFDNGVAKLEVTEANISKERETAFADKAAEEGYTVSNIVDISLYSAIYKGGKKDAEGNYLSWDTAVNNLDSKATISLRLQEDMSNKDIAIIHEKHDGTKVTGYELVEVTYDNENNAIEFEEDSFSNFAIVVKSNGDNNEGPQNPDEVETVTVSFNSTGGTEIAPIVIDKGTKVIKPADPENSNKTFEGWYLDEAYHDEFDFNSNVNQDITLYAKWNEKGEKYNITDDNGNSISFNEEENHQYKLTIVDYLSFSKEEVMAQANISSEVYDETFDGLKNLTKSQGTLISFFEITVTNEDGFQVHEGPFTIKIKMTDAMKKYKSFKLICVDDMKLGEIVTLKVQGEYLVGTIPHLSNYSLVGSTSSNPQTGDNIMNYVIMFGLGFFGLIGSSFYLKKRTIGDKLYG